MTQQVRLYSSPGFHGKPRKFSLSVLASSSDIRAGDWVRLPGWRTPFVHYRIDEVYILQALDAFPPGPLSSLYLSQVTIDQGRWFRNHLEGGLLLDIEPPKPDIVSPGEADTPPRLPRWLRWLEHDV